MKRIILILGLCLGINLYSEDKVILDVFNGMFVLGDDNLTITIQGEINSNTTGISANNSIGWIDIYGSINTNYGAISAQNMSGDITLFDSGSIEGDSYAIFSQYMTGSIIINGGDLLATDGGSTSGIFSNGMIGNISNLSEGTIRGTWTGIDAEGMVGDIYNDVGSIIGSSDYYDSVSMHGIYAEAMTGNILNWGTISGLSTGIYAYEMEGNITNNGNINASGSDGIYAESMEGDILNEGLINGDDSGIYAEGMIGDIYNYGQITGESGIAINSTSMTGSITNNGTITGYEDGIYGIAMEGDIYNYEAIRGSFAAESGYAIGAESMLGDIVNYEDGLIVSYNDHAIYAYEMIGNIFNSGEIISLGGIAIDAENMSGHITNYGEIVGDFYGINSKSMKGNIENYNLVYGDDAGIFAEYMDGNIYNYAGAIIDGANIGIDADKMIGDIYNYFDGYISGINIVISAEQMSGSIYNHGTIEGDSRGIMAYNMSGNIYNYGIINAQTGIEAGLFQGDIYNYGTINATGYAIYIDEAGSQPTIYNYGTIEGKITGIDGLNIIGNGMIYGDIISYFYSGAVNISNDVEGTILDLTNVEFRHWDTINLLQGEMTITGIIGSNPVTVNQSGDATVVHFGADHWSLNYYLNAGTLNPYSDSSAFKTLWFDEFYASAGSIIEIDFANESGSDKIYAVDDEGGEIEAGVTIRFIPQSTSEAGWSEYYNIFENIDVSADVLYEVPLLYTVEGVEIVIDALGPADYWVEISRKDESYADHATYYNRSVAKYIDINRSYEDMPEEAEDLLLALEQAGTADEFNALLEPYNMVGYASLANNNVNWINNRTGNLFNILNNGGGSETSASNSTIGSGYATANPDVRRDANGNNIWFDVYMSDNTLDGKDGYELESDGYEVAFGIDKEMTAALIAGISFNYSDFESDITGGLPVSVESKGIGVNTYGQYTVDQLTHKVVLGYTAYSNDANRAGAKADFDSDEIYAAYRAEYLIEKKSFNIIPVAGLQYSHITYDDIIEDGGNSGLEGYDYDSLELELGVKLVKQLEACRINAGLSWIHELLDTETDATAVSGIGSYDQDGIERDEDVFRLSVGLDYQINDRINLGLDYAKEFGDNTDSDSINGKISFSF